MTLGRYHIAAIVAVLFLGSGLIALTIWNPLESERARRKVIAVLSERLRSEVELEEMSVDLVPRLRISGRKLAVHHLGRRDLPPLIAINAFTVDASLVGLWRKRVDRVVVDGLDIQIPPKEDRKKGPGDTKSTDDGGRDFSVDELVADSATLTIIPKDPTKTPRVWQMHQLRLQQVGADQTMPFQSVLTNAVPPGQIVTRGTFGPWGADDPGQTPLTGEFTFDNADLGVFKGIAGTLSSRGTFGGILERIDIHGATETPDFTLRVSEHPVPLRTKYHAIVDGTNGETTLSQVDATFLETSLIAKGGVFNTPGVKGRTVTLEITMADGKLEDVMRLAVKTDRAPMTGTLSLKTTFVLPPGDVDVVEKLGLEGAFTIGGGHFTDPTVQKKIVELSRRATVEDGDRKAAPNVDSDFSGRFKLGNGVLSLPTVAFVVPGAAVELSGRYSLERETIAFAGNLFMDAKISQTMTGWKSLLLKLVDPLFRRDGETVIPIKIEGTRNNPSFGLDAGRIFKRDPVERPKTPAKVE